MGIKRSTIIWFLVAVVLSIVATARSAAALASAPGQIVLDRQITRPATLVQQPAVQLSPTSGPFTPVPIVDGHLPPPLVSNKYLDDQSLLSAIPCGPPCFQNISPGQATFKEAIEIVKANALFRNLQIESNSQTADWATRDGVSCCQMTGDEQGLVNAVLIKLAPNITVGQLIQKYGEPTYVASVDYSAAEVGVTLVFPGTGLIVFEMPGNATSTLKETDPIVIALYISSARIYDLLATSTLKGWSGYLPYRTYQNATPVVTPMVTLTPAP